jgi:hypothetical protein
VTSTFTVGGYQTQGTHQNGWIFNLEDKGDRYNYDSAAYNSNTLAPQVTPPISGQEYNLNCECTDIGIVRPNVISVLTSYAVPSGAGNPVFYKSVISSISIHSNLFLASNNGDEFKRKLNASPKQMVMLPGDTTVFLSSTDTLATSTHYVHLVLFDQLANKTITNWYYFDSPGGFTGGSIDAVKMKYNAWDNSFIVLATLTSISGSYSIVLFKIDGTNGTEIWRRTFGNNDYYVGGGLDLTPDGGYIITGYNNTGAYNQSVLVIKTNKDGFIE